VPAATTEWIRVGEIIGIQLEGSGEWGIGSVRRVVRDEHRQYHVGIQMLSRSVRLVRIAHPASREPEAAILLSSDPAPTGEVGVLLRAGRFDANHQIAIVLEDRDLIMNPVGMITAGDDFDWATYSPAG
jgi:hypothetical protein